ncbi:MAG TPA: hypothetical protein VKX28_26680 [Xanthobacteraceae bacterium]|nr:hypothetical protein [Xanthobacteraceae bacterium]
MSDVTIGNGSGTYDVTGAQGGTITVGNGSDTVVVAGGSDQTITVGNGSDTLTVDGATGDSIRIGNGSDTVTVSGGSGNTIVAGNGNDTVVASADQNDTITVGNGHDTVYAGANDTITVGKGSDTVVLPSSIPTLSAPASITVPEDSTIGMGLVAALSPDAFGQEKIYGFAAGDKIVVSTSQFANFSALLADARQVGQNTVISADPSDTITLENFQLSSLKSNNVVFASGGSSATVSLTIAGLPSDATLSSAADPTGVSFNAATSTWTIAAGALADLTLHAGDATSATLQVTATDSATGDSISRTIALTVTSAPTIGVAVNGTPEEGQVLTAAVTGGNGQSLTYQWQRSADGTHWSNIANATGASYTVQEGDETDEIRVQVTPAGGSPATSAATAAVSDQAPGFASGAAISGTAQEGQTLTASASGTEAGWGITYQWQQDGHNIAGATGATYVVQEGDEGHTIDVVATVTNDDGKSASSTSTATAAVSDQAPGFASGAAITGTAQEGQTLTASAAGTEAGWGISYQWQQDGHDIAGATGATYVVQEGDEGHTIDVVATVTNDDGKTASSTSTATAAVSDQAPGFASGAAISGTAQEGQTLTASASGTEAGWGITYQWQQDGHNIAGATGATYVVQEGDEGHTIDVVATVTNDDGKTASSTSTATSAVTDNASLSVTLSMLGSGATQQGQVLSASATITGDTDDLAAPITYQWQKSSNGGTTWTNVPATASGLSNNILTSFYQLGEGDEGSIFRAVASFTDDTGQVMSAMSAPTSTVADVPPVLSTPFSYAADEFKIVRGSAIFDDTFAGGPPPVAGVFGNSPVVFSTSVGSNASTWTESGGKAIMSSSGAVSGGVGAEVQALLVTNTQPEGTGSGQSNSGLKENGTFTVSGTFDLTTPVPGGGGYGIGLTNATTGVAQSESVELMVQRSNTGGDNIVLLQFNPSTNAFQSIANQVLTAQQVSGNTQIELDLSHNTVNTSTITASFELIDNGTQTGATTFTTTGHVFDSQTYTRALLFSTAAKAAQISGTAQEGQTLTASVGANDGDLALAYQWQRSTDNGNTWSSIAGATNATYVVQEADENAVLRVAISATDPDDPGAVAGTVFSSATAKVVDAAPTVNTPVITGNAQEGQMLTVSATTGDLDDPVNYTWYSSQSGYTVQIGSGANYTVQEADEGWNIEAKATVTNENGVTASATSAPTATVVDAAPTVTIPVISGVAQEGQTLTASASSGQPDNFVTYTWYSSADNYTNPIGYGPTLVVPESADALTATSQDGLINVVDLHTIEVKATVTNQNGVSVSAMSAPTAGIADAPPAFLVSPTISGTAQEGQALFAFAAGVQPDNPVTYAWYSHGTEVGTGTKYVVQETDEGSTITVVATVTNEQGQAVSQTSAPTAVVTDAPPQFALFPTISGLGEEGQTLVASATAAQNDNPVTYTWYSSVDNFTNPIGFGDSYTAQESDETRQLKVVATITNDDGATVSSASNSIGILDAPPTVATPTISGTLAEGQILSASDPGMPEADASDIVYEWFSSADGYTNPIARTPYYIVQEADEGYSIGVRAIALNDYNAITNDGVATSGLATTGPVADDGADHDPPTNNGNIIPSVINGDGQDVVFSYASFALAGNGDTIAGSWDTVNAADNTTVNVDGTSNIVNGNGLAVNVSDAFVTLTGAGDHVSGQQDIISLQGADAVVDGAAQEILLGSNLNVTLTGSNDIVGFTFGASNNVINLQDGANLIGGAIGSNVTINGNNVTFNGQVNGLVLTGSNDTVEGFANIIDLPDGSGVTLKNEQGATVYGNNEVINATDPTNSIVLMGDGDVVNGDNAVIQMPNGGTATLNGNNDQVYGANEILYVANKNIALGALNGGTDQLVGATIIGSNDQITLPVQTPSTTTSLTIEGTNDTLFGSGQAITIADGASIQYVQTSGVTVTFGGATGTLQLAGPGSFDPNQQNAVVGFTGQDQIDIGGLVYGVTTTVNFTENAAGTGGTLTVTNGPGTATSNILLYGDYTTANFALASDGHGGTLVTDPPAPTQAQLASSHT